MVTYTITIDTVDGKTRTFKKVIGYVVNEHHVNLRGKDGIVYVPMSQVFVVWIEEEA